MNQWRNKGNQGILSGVHGFTRPMGNKESPYRQYLLNLDLNLRIILSLQSVFVKEHPK